MLKHIKQNLLILTMGLLILVLCLLLVLELKPANLSGLEISEIFTASSATINMEDKTYSGNVVGRIYNPTDSIITPESLTITVSNEDGETKVIEIEGTLIPPRTEWICSQNWEETVKYDRVLEVSVLVDGVSDQLPNRTSTVQAKGLVFLYGALLLMVVGIFVRSCKTRYYMYQEDQMAENQSQNNGEDS